MFTIPAVYNFLKAFGDIYHLANSEVIARTGVKAPN